MANWCYTKYVITGSKEEISKVYSILNRVSNDTTNPHKDWLGSIVAELGADNTKMKCRGSFDKVMLVNKSTLKLTTWSAWGPCYELFEYIIKKFPSLKYYYKAEEPGCGLFETNDSEKRYFGYGKKYDICDNNKMIGKLCWEVYLNCYLSIDQTDEERDKAVKKTQYYVMQNYHDNSTGNSIN